MYANLNQYLIFLLIALSIASCGGEDGSSLFKPKRVSPPSIEDRVTLSNAENLGRDSWQKPALIVEKLGDLKGKKIADIGAGTGYFTFYLAYLQAEVIAIDIDQEMLKYIDTYKRKMRSDISPNISIRLGETDDPKLAAEELDMALIVNTVGYIENLSGYLSTLRLGIKKGGRLVISDYKATDAHIPSPTPDKIVSINKLTADLTTAGYTDIIVDDTSLEYQYIITSSVPL